MMPHSGVKQKAENPIKVRLRLEIKKTQINSNAIS